MPAKEQFQDRPVELTTTIANGTAISSQMIDLVGVTLCGLIIPASWTAAGIGIKAASSATGTFLPVYNEIGTLVSITVNSSSCIILNAADFAGLQYIKLWSQTGGSDVNQVGDKIITLLTRPI